MALKLLKLRRDDTCARCATAVSARSMAWWDRYSTSVVCVICEPVRRDDPLPPPPAIERGAAGASAEQEYERRVAKHQEEIEARWGSGLVGRLMRSLAEEPASTTAFATGADGERRLGRLLDTELIDAVALHDRKVPTTRGNLDHLVVAPSGVWLIDAKRYSGEVEQRRASSFGSSEPRLYVDGRNQNRLVEAMAWQVAAVRAQLGKIGFGDVAVHPVVCFTSSVWRRRAEPFEIDGVLVTWPAALVRAINADGPFDPRMVDLLARHLSATLAAYGPTAATH